MNIKKLGLLAGPLLFVLILLFFKPESLSQKGIATLAAAVWIGTWWITEAIPIAVTALLPLVLFPILGIMDIKHASNALANPMIFLFLGGFIIAAAIEKTNLHKRIALTIISRLGTQWNKVILGFMIATAFLSMWISNTATAVMMLPIGIAVITQINVTEDLKKSMGQSLMFAIAYGCSIGGIATIIGTPTNVIFVGIIEEQYNTTISFTQWLSIGLPFTIIMLIIAWLYLTKSAFPSSQLEIPGGQKTIKKELHSLGKITYEEKSVLVLFVAVALSWISSSFLLKKIIPGINDTVIAIIGAICLFIIPSKNNKKIGIINWETAQKIPWGILLLFGGGLALAEGFKISGLANWLGNQMNLFDQLPLFVLILILVTIVNFLTEITSNVATAAMLMPVLAALAISIDTHPYLLMIAATIAASCAFMLPVATPPNAVIFGSGLINIPKMAKVGLWMNLCSILLISIIVYFLLPWLWNIDIQTVPELFK